MANSQSTQINTLQKQIASISSRLNLSSSPRLVAARPGSIGTPSSVDRETIEESDLVSSGIVSGQFIDLNTSSPEVAADRCPSGYIVATHPNDQGEN